MKILTATNVTAEDIPNTQQVTLSIFLEDTEGNKYLTAFTTQGIYSETIRKTFGRLKSIKAKEVEDAIRESSSSDS